MKLGDGVLYQGQYGTVIWVDPIKEGVITIETEDGVAHETRDTAVQLPDKHKEKAMSIFNVKYHDVNSIQRRVAKVSNFGRDYSV